MAKKRKSKTCTLYIIGNQTFGNSSIEYKDREKLSKFLNKHNLHFLGITQSIFPKDTKFAYSKKHLKKIFNRISKHLKRGIITFVITNRVRNRYPSSEAYVTVMPNKVLWIYLGKDIFGFSYPYLTEKVFPYINKQTKQDLAVYLSAKIRMLSSELEKYGLLMGCLLKEEKE